MRQGNWGKVSLSLKSDAPAKTTNWLGAWVDRTFKNTAKPKCDIFLNNAAKKWSLNAEAAAIAKWIKSAYPDLPAPVTSSANVAGQAHNVQHWQAGSITAILSLASAKQSEPNSDLLFRIEDKGPPPAKP